MNNTLKEKDIFSGGVTSLWKIINNIGFHYKKDDPKRALIETPHIALKRVTFLQQYMRIKQDDVREFIFLDETWVFQDGTIGKYWQNDCSKSVKATKVGGKR